MIQVFGIPEMRLIDIVGGFDCRHGGHLIWLVDETGILRRDMSVETS